MTFHGVAERFALCRRPGSRSCASATLPDDALDVRRCEALECRVQTYPLEHLLPELEREP